MNRNFFCIVIFLLGAPLSATATQYYVDSVGGSDGNLGTSPGAAFASLSKLAPLTLSPGDRIWLRRGSVFRYSQLAFGGNGTEAEPIIVDAYGEGMKPEILASVRPLAGWSLHSGECYKQYVPPEMLIGDPVVNGVFHYTLDNASGPVRLEKQTVVPTTRGSYYFDEISSMLYVITSDGRSPAANPVEVSVM